MSKITTIYDALENITKQCFSDRTASFNTKSDPNGNWSAGDEWYGIMMNYTMPAASSEGDIVEADGCSIGG